MASLILMSILLSIMFLFLSHPLSFGLIIILQTITICVLTGMLHFDYWFSYIFFLIMIGGMLILFIYMTSIASNEKFKFSVKLMLLICIYLLMIIILMFSDVYMLMMDLNNYDSMNQSYQNNNLSMNKYMNMPNMILMIMMMIYLLITLIAIAKITKSNLGPLRQTKF